MTISNQDRFAILLAFIVPILASAPIFAGYLSSAPPEKIFMGLDFVDDFHWYVSMVRESQDTLSPLVSNRATTEPQEGHYLSLYFWIQGLVSRFTGLPIPIVFVTFRILAEAAFFISLWFLLNYFFQEPAQKMTGYLLVLFSGGAGWLTALLGNFILALARLRSSDLTYTLGYNTFGYLYSPLPFLSYALFVLCTIFLFKFWETKERKNLLYALIFFGFIFFNHPVSAILFYAIIGFLAFVPLLLDHNWKKTMELLNTVKFFIIPLAIAIVYFLWALSDPVYSATVSAYSQGFQRTESVFFYPIGFGLILLFAVNGAKNHRIPTDWAKYFLFSWVAVAFLLAVNPWKGIRFLFGLHVPLVILSTYGLYHFLEIHRKARWMPSKKSAVLAFVILVSISSPLILNQRIQEIQTNNFEGSAYLSEKEIKAMQFLDQQPKSNVLSGYRAGNNLIWMTPHYAYLGHQLNVTIERSRKAESVRQFFSPQTSTEWKKQLLQENKIRFIYYGPEERVMGFVDESLPVRKVFDNEKVQIFALTYEILN